MKNLVIAVLLLLSVPLAQAGSYEGVSPGATTAGLTHAELVKVQADLGPALETAADGQAALAMLKEKLGEPELAYSEGWLMWAVTDQAKCSSLVLTLFLEDSKERADLAHKVHDVGSPGFFACVDAAHRADPGTAYRASFDIDSEEYEAEDRLFKMLIIGGLVVFFVLAIGIIVVKFRGARNVWAEFGAAHGLAVSGLEVGGEPRVTGSYQGVEVEVGLGAVGTLRMRGMGKFEISDTHVIAMFKSPLTGGLHLTASDIGNHPLLADPSVGPALVSFLQQNRQAFIASDGVCASISAMPSDVATLKRVVDSCVQCVSVLDARQRSSSPGQE